VHDLVIRSGRVVDGSGAAARTADVAVTDGVITEVGRVDGLARRTLDADGAVVTPGFVDIHTHFDGQATWDPHLVPSCWHGVTTAIVGNCGVGFAPVRPGQHDRLIEVMEGVEDIPGVALAEGMPWSWESFSEYLDVLDALPRAVDVAAHVPHAALRTYVLGPEREHEPATAAEVVKMRELVRDAMEAGAVGVTIGRTAGHRDSRGAHVPGTFAPSEEVGALVQAMAEVGHGVLQVVPAGVGGAVAGEPRNAMDLELEWMIRYGVESGLPVTFLVMQSNDEPDRWRGWFELAREANARGAQIRPQVASRCFGVLMGLQSRLNPLRHRASFSAVAELPLNEQVERLRDPHLRSRILADAPSPDASGLDAIVPATFENLFPLGPKLDYEPGPQQSVAAIARRERRDPWDVLYDSMLGADGHELLLYPMLNFGGGSLDGIGEMLADPITVQGLGDGGAHCAILCDASMSTYLVTHWSRDRARGRISLETAVKRLTRDGAQLYGLDDRGVLAPGCRGDVNVFDYDALGLVYPERVADLPAGGSRLVQGSRGYIETIVRGESIVVEGELTDARPGRLVRASGRAPDGRDQLSRR
jgi:N-acyl-D-aspartate/D-glutamate deacylase